MFFFSSTLKAVDGGSMLPPSTFHVLQNISVNTDTGNVRLKEP